MKSVQDRLDQALASCDPSAPILMSVPFFRYLHELNGLELTELRDEDGGLAGLQTLYRSTHLAGASQSLDEAEFQIFPVGTDIYEMMSDEIRGRNTPE